MSKIFQAIVQFFVNLCNPAYRKKLQDGLMAIAPYIDAAIKIVSELAAVTGNRTLGEIEQAAQKYQVKLVLDPNADKQAKSDAVKTIAKTIILRAYPALADRQVNRLIEVAYGSIEP